MRRWWLGWQLWRKAPRGAKVILALFALLYIVSPIDAIPDVLPLIGWLDDALVALVAVASWRERRLARARANALRR